MRKAREPLLRFGLRQFLHPTKLRGGEPPLPRLLPPPNAPGASHVPSSAPTPKRCAPSASAHAWPVAARHLLGSPLRSTRSAYTAFAGFFTTMRESDSQNPLTQHRSGSPLHRCARPDHPTVDSGSLLFRGCPWRLDVSNWPQMAQLPRHFRQPVLPAIAALNFDAFNVSGFGDYPHTSNSFLSTLRTYHLRYARNTRLTLPCLWLNVPAFHQLGLSTACRTHSRPTPKGLTVRAPGDTLLENRN